MVHFIIECYLVHSVLVFLMSCMLVSVFWHDFFNVGFNFWVSFELIEIDFCMRVYTWLATWVCLEQEY